MVGSISVTSAAGERVKMPGSREKTALFLDHQEGMEETEVEVGDLVYLGQSQCHQIKSLKFEFT